MRRVEHPGVGVAAVALFLCAPLSALCEEPASKPASEAPARKQEALQAKTEADPTAEITQAFKPPPGFRAKKRGDAIVWCRKESPLGSRFPEVKCYDEAQLRELSSRPQWAESIKACGKGSCSTN